jgi:hypothetical protein
MECVQTARLSFDRAAEVVTSSISQSLRRWIGMRKRRWLICTVHLRVDGAAQLGYLAPYFVYTILAFVLF